MFRLRRIVVLSEPLAAFRQNTRSLIDETRS